MAIYQPGVNMMADGGNSPIALSPEQIAALSAVSDARANAEATAKLIGGTVDENGMVVMPANYQTRSISNTPLSTNQKIANTISAYAADHPAPAGTHYGTTLGPDGNPILYKDLTASSFGLGGNVTGAGITGGTGSGITGGTGTGAGAVTVNPGGSVNANPGALQIVTDALKQAGLGSLASKAWTMWNQGFDINAIMDDPINGIRAQPVYKQNFPAMAALNAAGQGITEAAYLFKEQADIQLLKQFGIPSGVFDTKDYLGSLMTNNVTTQDLQGRLQAVADTVNSFDPSVKKYALDNYGLDAGHLAAWALDPTKALPVIQQQAKAVQIGGAALMNGFAGGLGANGELSTAQSEALAGAGVTQSQAQTGFNNIGQQGQFAQALPGDVSGNVSNQQLINAQFGMNPNDVIALKKVQQARINEFNAGGAVVGNAAGLSGLGTSNATA